MEHNNIGHIISKRRKDLALKQEDLAEMAGVTAKTIYLIENNKGNPSLDTLYKILDILGMELTINIKKVTE